MPNGEKANCPDAENGFAGLEVGGWENRGWHGSLHVPIPIAVLGVAPG
ncbi:MAG: hypothetical protein AAB363_02230 [Planctomycetota bacterium]